jgi:hypothetical protein
LVTPTDKQLTHAVLHPQPAGTFNQVGDDWMLARKRLSAKFKSSLPTHETSPTPPLAEIDDSDAPPRVQITVSPSRVQQEAIPPRVVLPTTTNVTVQNSHRRLQPTRYRAVTPSTPHPMVRRSAAEQNLSNDTLAETV